MNKENNKRKVVTGLVTLSYVNVLAPHAIADGAAEKYSVSVVIPKSDTKTIKDCEEAIKAAYEEGKQKLSNGKTCPPMTSIKLPMRDGDVERSEDPVYKDSYFINANSNVSSKPQVVDANCQPIISPDDCYSGCKGRVSICFYAYNTNGNKGIAAGLQNVQVLEKGEPLGNRNSAENDFLPFADDDAKDDFLK